MNPGFSIWNFLTFPPFHIQMSNSIIQNEKVSLLAEIYRSGAKSVHLNIGIPFLTFDGVKFAVLGFDRSSPEDSEKRSEQV